MRTLSFEDAHLLNNYFHAFDYQGAQYSLLANYVWRTDYDIRWEIIGDYLIFGLMYQGDDGALHGDLSIPLTRSGVYNPARVADTVLEARRRFEAAGCPVAIGNIPAHMVPLLQAAMPGQMTFAHNRDLDEYVYEKDRLITLSGRALHKKKNHLNYFQKTYEYEVKPLTKAMLPDILALSDLVREGRPRTEDEVRSLQMEKNAIHRIVEFLDFKYVYATAIFIDGGLRGYAVGERLSRDTAAEHFEKADVRYRGIYQAVCSAFCQTLPEDVRFVNREEDMGLENLRQAKLALRPHHLAEKYRGEFL